MNKQILMTKQFAIKRPDGTSTSDHVLEYQERIETNAGWADGLKFYVRDSDEAPLNQISATEYEVVTTGEKIHV